MHLKQKTFQEKTNLKKPLNKMFQKKIEKKNNERKHTFLVRKKLH